MARHRSTASASASRTVAVTACAIALALVVAVLNLDLGGPRRSVGALGAVDPRGATPSASAAPSPSPSPSALPVTEVLGLGDSVPEAAGCGCTSFVQRVAAQLTAAEHRRVPMVNLAQGGLTSAGLLSQCRTRGLGAPPGALTLITIGANDFDSQPLSTAGHSATDHFAGYQDTLGQLRRNLSAVLTQLSAGAHGPIMVTGYWNVFLDGQVGRRQGSAYARDSDALTLTVNALLRQVATAAGATFVDLYHAFKDQGQRDDTALLAADGDHPSSAGHAVIAAQVLAQLRSGGTSS